jgi:hypothetical protein
MVVQQLKTLETGIYKAGLEFLTAVVIKTSIFWDITPYSLMKVKGTFRRNTSPHFRAYSSALNMKAKCSSETSANFHRTTQRYIQKIELWHIKCVSTQE